MAAERAARSVLFACAVLLAGCSGGQVALKSGMPAASPVTTPAGGNVGISVSGGGGLTWAVLLGLVLADGIHWLSTRFASTPEQASPETRPVLWQPIDRGWVDRGP